MRTWTHLVDAEALMARLPGGGATGADLLLLDCRHDLADPTAGPAAYTAGHLPGAVHAHVDHDLSGHIDLAAGTGRHPLPEPAAFRARLGAWGITPETQVVAYDDAGGAWAARVWWLLRHYGHAQVAVLDGGLQAAVTAGAQLTSAPPARTPTDFAGGPGHMPTVDAASIQARLPAAPGTLLDARDAERYRGDVEPIDPVAGHVPGALSVPFKGNLGPDGRFLSRDALAKRFRQALGDRRGDEVAVYCGSGVTAAHDVLAMEHAGLGTPALYPGSWSHWVADRERPVTKGAAPA